MHYRIAGGIPLLLDFHTANIPRSAELVPQKTGLSPYATVPLHRFILTCFLLWQSGSACRIIPAVFFPVFHHSFVSLPLPYHLGNDFRTYKASVTYYGGFILHSGFPKPFTYTVNDALTEQRFSAEPRYFSLFTRMRTHNEANDLFDGLRCHGGLRHTLLIAVNAPRIATKGRQNSIALYALLTVKCPHECGNLIVVSALILVRRDQELCANELIIAFPHPGCRRQCAFDTLLCQVVEDI